MSLGQLNKKFEESILRQGHLKDAEDVDNVV